MDAKSIFRLFVDHEVQHHGELDEGQDGDYQFLVGIEGLHGHLGFEGLEHELQGALQGLFIEGEGPGRLAGRAGERGGRDVEADQPLFELSSDKIDTEVPSK